MRKTYVGIDPGSKGFAVFYLTDKGAYVSVPLSDTHWLCEMFRAAADSGDCMVAIEDVHAMHGQGVTSTFTFGMNCGIVRGLVMAFGLPFVTVPPQAWQKVMLVRDDKVKRDGKVDTKASSLNAARRLHPEMDFRRNAKCRKADDNLVDALLICDYAKRMNL